MYAIYPSPEGSVMQGDAKKGGSRQIGPFDFTADGFQTFTVGMQFIGLNNQVKDWSLVAWGESGDVYVYNLDGSKTDDWGKSANMRKLGPNNKPASWNPAGKNAIKEPNRKAEKLTKVANPKTPKPEAQQPEKAFAKWAAANTKVKNIENYASGR